MVLFDDFMSRRGYNVRLVLRGKHDFNGDAQRGSEERHQGMYIHSFYFHFLKSIPLVHDLLTLNLIT